MNEKINYSSHEIMTIVAAREINNGDIVFCGTGISMLAAMAAKNINAPESVVFFETGAIDSELDEIPLSVGDPRVMYHTSSNSSLIDSFAFMQNKKTGSRVIGILGAAQIDKFGNLNSTVIGDYSNPDIRFSGSGGAADVASFVPESIIFMQHQKRKFVKTLDYLTSSGYINGPNGRKNAGLPEGGPKLVITDLGVLRFDNKTKEMYLAGYYPGILLQQILDNMSFGVDVSKAKEIQAPTKNELKILREKCDPQGLIL